MGELQEEAEALDMVIDIFANSSLSD